MSTVNLVTARRVLTSRKHTHVTCTCRSVRLMTERALRRTRRAFRRANQSKFAFEFRQKTKRMI